MGASRSPGGGPRLGEARASGKLCGSRREVYAVEGAAGAARNEEGRTGRPEAIGTRGAARGASV